eukprot:XP_006605102.1 uncharacterized protein LOC100814862 [Glycine max]
MAQVMAIRVAVEEKLLAKGEARERSKGVKFINGLRPEVKMMVNFHDTQNFAQLTNMCRIFDEDQREKVAFYRNANASHGKKKKLRTRGFQPTNGGLHPASGSSHPVNRVSQPTGRGGGSGGSGGGGGAPAALAMPSPCANRGKIGHFACECSDSDVTCFNCRGKGHISTSCPHPRREKSSGSLNNQNGRLRTTGRVFALSGADVALSDDLIQGICFISQVPLVVLYDSGATQLFISRVYVEKLALPVSSLKFDLIVDTPASGSILTSDVEASLREDA